MTPSTTVVLLLRGVNLGKRRMAMADLRQWLGDAGLVEVRTYIQSGNVVARAPVDSGDMERLGRGLAEVVSGHCGFDVPMVVRTADELAATIECCPFPTDGDPKRLCVAFASEPLNTSEVEMLAGVAEPPDRLEVVGRDLYLWLPDGQARSALAEAVATRRRGPTLTVRNWRTVSTLAEWAGVA